MLEAVAVAAALLALRQAHQLPCCGVSLLLPLPLLQLHRCAVAGAHQPCFVNLLQKTSANTVVPRCSRASAVTVTAASLALH
jgi:hypothetical protein